MTPTTIKQILDTHKGQVRVHLSDGRSLVAGEAEHIIPMRESLFVAYDPDEVGLPARFRYINYRQVVEIEPLPSDQDEAA